MKRSLLFLLSLSSCLLHAFSNPQDYHFKQYTGREGLSSEEITSIKQDTAGYVWVGTNDGLNKLDGYTFEVYRNNRNDSNSLSGNHIHFVDVDRKGNVWVGTNYGLSMYNPQQDHFNHPLGSHANTGCVALLNDNAGNYWVAPKDGYIHVFDSLYRLKTIMNPASGHNWLDAGRINDIVQDHRGLIWIATPQGLYQYDPASNAHELYPVYDDTGREDEVMSVYEDSEKILWIVAAHGLYYKESGRSRMQKASIAHDPSASFNQVIEDKTGTLWVPMGHAGIAYYNKKNRTFTTLSPDECRGRGVAAGVHRFIECDHQGNIWVGGLNTSLNLLQKDFRHFQTILPEPGNPGAPHNSIRSFVQDAYGNIWVATQGSIGVWSRHAQAFTNIQHAAVTNEPVGDNNNIRINTLYMDGNERIWYGGRGTGVGYYTDTSEYAEVVIDTGTATSSFAYDVRDIVEGGDGMIWFITHGKGLYQVDPFSMQIVNNFKVTGQDQANSIISDEGLQLHSDRNGNIWIGTDRGLSIYDIKRGKFTNYTLEKDHINSLAGEAVYAFYESADGTMWIGTNGGLSRFNPSSKDFTNYTYTHGLANNRVMAIQEDDRGKLWLSTSSGITAFDPQNETFKNYDKNDGLPGNEFNTGASYKTAQNELLFGGPAGFVVFDPGKIGYNPYAPRVYFTAFELFDQEVDYGNNRFLEKHIHFQDRIRLPFNQNVFTINYVGINYIKPEGTVYKYKMEGFDEKWHEAGNKRAATYTNLSPGKYTFKVIAANSDGVWNQDGASVSFRIRPPWYRSTVFYIFLVLAAGSLLYAYSRHRERLVQRDKLSLEQQIKKGEQELEKQKEALREQQKKLEQRDAEEMEMRFMTEGIAKFSDIISQYREQLDALGQHSISELVEYVDGNMGVIYMLNDEQEGNEFLGLKGAYAADEKKIQNKQYKIGEGYIGTCFQDAETKVIEEVPEDYIKMESGLGESKPAYLYLIPLKQNEIVQGVIEIGSFVKIEDYKIRFLEKIAENITSVIAITKSSKKAQAMLERSNQQAEELKAQEEELRQNLEEMQATQEELKRKMEENEKMQEDLKYEKALLDAILDNFPDNIYFKDLDSKLLRVSKSMVKAKGVSRVEDLIGKSDFDFHDKESAQAKYDEEQRIIKTREGVIDLIEHDKLEDGSEKWVSTTKLPFYDKDGDVIGTFGISKDVTQLKEAEISAQQNNEELQAQEEELRQNMEEMQATQDELQRRMEENEKMQEDLKYEKALLDAILDNFPDNIYFKDLNSKFLRVSKSMVQAKGVSKVDDLIGKSDFDFHDKESSQAKYDEEQKIIKTGKGVTNLIEHDKLEDGTEIWVSTTKLPFYNKDGKVIGTFGISKDVTQLKEAEISAQQNNEELQAQEEELRQNMEEMQATQEELQRRMEENEKMQEDLKYEKALLDAILDNLPDNIYFKDLDSKLLRVSKSMVKAKGMSKVKDLIGKTDFDFHDKESAQAKYDEEQRIIKTKKGIIDLVEHDVIEDGTEKWVSTTKLPFYNKDGKVIGTFGISKDITTLKKVEIEAVNQKKLLEQSEEELRQNIEELTATQDELMEKQDMLMWESAMFNTLMDHLQARISFKDKEGKFRRVSRTKALKHNFKSPDDIIGMSDYDFFSKEHADKAFAEEQELLKKGKPILDIEEKLVMKDGSLSWGLTSRIPFANSDGEIIGSFVMTRDVTDIKLARAELDNNHTIIKGLAANTPVLVYRTDVERKLKDIKGAGLKLMNAKEKDLKGKLLEQVFEKAKESMGKEVKNTVIFREKGKINNETWEVEHHVFADGTLEGALVGYAYKTALV